MTTRYALKKARPDISGRDDSAGRTEVKANGYVLAGRLPGKTGLLTFAGVVVISTNFPYFYKGALAGIAQR
ncbi:hypothetical protein QB964_003209 [Salmonella enterica]|nr:hypothetical protein [Salmonella enterica]